MSRHFVHCALLVVAASALGAVGPAIAHDVQAVVEDGPPRRVTLAYGDGEPFAYEAYELRAQGAPAEASPVQAGRTSETGGVVIDPRVSDVVALRLRAFSADGHGIDLLLPAVNARPAAAAPIALTAAPTAGDRLARGAAGVAAIAALYGLWFARRRRRARARSAQD
ncbi:MAG: ABC transporter permease [Burkholderiales bacterium]|nr:ABC transporter permease [Burkholderiales bacterium]